MKWDIGKSTAQTVWIDQQCHTQRCTGQTVVTWQVYCPLSYVHNKYLQLIRLNATKMHKDPSQPCSQAIFSDRHTCIWYLHRIVYTIEYESSRNHATYQSRSCSKSLNRLDYLPSVPCQWQAHCSGLCTSAAIRLLSPQLVGWYVLQCSPLL